MTDRRTGLEQLLTKLKRERDELKLQVHLASMDGKDEYERISDQVDKLAAQFEPAKEAVEETAVNVWSALELAAQELEIGFGRVRKAIEKSE
jgi:seryl-tRNA synthetase